MVEIHRVYYYQYMVVNAMNASRTYYYRYHDIKNYRGNVKNKEQEGSVRNNN